jgi:hypothetical protein
MSNVGWERKKKLTEAHDVADETQFAERVRAFSLN